MNEKTKLGLYILLAASIVGLLADLLLRETPWGLNFCIWTIIFLSALFLLTRHFNTNWSKDAHWLILTVLPFAAAFAWRDSTTLKFLNVLAIFAGLSLMAMHAKAIQIRLAGLMRYLWEITLTGLNIVCGIFPLLFLDIKWKEISENGQAHRAMAIGRGIIIALPLLLVFGALLMAADAVFEGIIKNVLHINLVKIFQHTFFTAFGAWLVAGFWRGIFLGQRAAIEGLERPKSLALGIVETGVALGLLNLLFLSFVIVQFRYFFGGAALVQVTEGLTYSEYARRGFFELVTVAALTLPLLLAGHWLLRKENSSHERIFQLLAAILILLLFVIMASAFQRMRLYQSEYGLTELRLYTTVFMAWLAAVFVWFTLTVLRSQRQRFVFGAVATGLVTIFALQIINPDALIVRTNAQLTKSGRPFDVNYAAVLSADAIPALVDALPSLSDQDRKKVVIEILMPKLASPKTDWRTWSWGRFQAHKTLYKNRESLQSTLNFWYYENFPILSQLVSF